MTTSSTTYSGSTRDSATMKLVSAKFALLAKVGHQKRKLSQSLAETSYYSGIVSELLALVKELSVPLESTLPPDEQLRLRLKSRSQLSNLAKDFIRTYPKDSDLQAIRCSLLDSGGREIGVIITDDGYYSLSSDLILDTVGLSLGATMEELQSP